MGDGEGLEEVDGSEWDMMGLGRAGTEIATEWDHRSTAVREIGTVHTGQYYSVLEGSTTSQHSTAKSWQRATKAGGVGANSSFSAV